MLFPMPVGAKTNTSAPSGEAEGQLEEEGMKWVLRTMNGSFNDLFLFAFIF